MPVGQPPEIKRAQPLALPLFVCGNDVRNSLWPLQRCNRPASPSERQNCGLVGAVPEKRNLMNGAEFFPAVQNFEQGWGGEHRNKFEEVTSTVKGFSLVSEAEPGTIREQNRLLQEMADHIIDV
jgi:hypothetical protein